MLIARVGYFPCARAFGTQTAGIHNAKDRTTIKFLVKNFADIGLLLLSLYSKFGPAAAGLKESRENGRFPHGKDRLGRIPMLY
jgi:hypothetical protein